MRQYTPEIEPWPSTGDSRLPVSEMFYSIQGEGRYAGTPALFIRFKYCNLGCIWCDTRFTWDKRKIEPGEWLSIDAITTRAASLVFESERGQTHIVLTGGEPMLHQEQIPSLIRALREIGFSFAEIETNGMYAPTEAMRSAIDWWNCSPKLTNNGMPRETNMVPTAILAIRDTDKADFKFVVQAENDIDEIVGDYLLLIPRKRVILMPEGVTRERQLALTPWVMDVCQKHGFRFSPRLHILAYGNERGK